MVTHIRWCVNINRWQPTKSEWLKLTSSIAAEELQRVNQFVFKDDAKSALVGRALIRNFLSRACKQPSDRFQLTRNEHGKPQLAPDTKGLPTVLQFNVSHSGDYCVLAGIHGDDESLSELKLGVDVTKIVKKKTKADLDRFLNLMSRREFLPDEWQLVARAETDRQKCINFTRLWCLKECYIKAIGLGLAFRLSRICFVPNEERMYDYRPEDVIGKTIGDTRVRLDGQLSDQWAFEESALDHDHLVAVAYNIDKASSRAHQILPESPYVELDVASICRDLQPLRPGNESDWALFCTRDIKSN